MARINILQEILQHDFIQTDWKITIDGQIYDSNKFKEYPSLNKSTKKIFGDCIMAECNFKLNDRDNNLDVKDKEVLIERLIRIDEVETWHKFGYFIIKEVTSDKSELSITCKAYDRMTLFIEPYKSKLSYPAKGIDIINEILQKRGVKMKGTFSFAEYVFETPNFKENISEREVIARMAELGGEHALINKEGFLEFRKPKKIEVIINGEHRTEYSLEKADKPIGQVSLGFKDYDDDYIKGTNLEGEQTFRIENNPYAELTRDKIIDKIYENIHGMQARAFNIKGAIGADFFEINDVFTFNDNQGNKQELTVLSIKTDGTLRGEVSADKIEYSSANYKIAGSVKEDLKRVGFEVNHINQTIKLQTEEISENSQKTTEITQNINNIESKVSSVEEKNNELEEKQTNLEQNVNNFKIEVKSSGGSNLMKNAALFNENTQGANYINWKEAKAEDIEAKESAELLNYGGISGRTITNKEEKNLKLVQVIPVKINEESSEENVYYSLSFRIKKGLSGTFSAVVRGEKEIYRTFELKNGEEAYFTEIKLEKILPKEENLYVEFNGVDANIELADIMLNVGTACSSWSTHVSESVSLGTVVDNTGLEVKTSNYSGSTKIDGRGLGGYYNGKRTFGTTRDLTWSDKFQAEKEITMSPIKIVPITSGINAGWNFVRNERNN